MLKNLIVIVSLALLLAACGGDNAEQADQSAVTLTVAQFKAEAADYVDKTVQVTGTVDHVCKHSGKRLFIMGDDPNDRIKIEVGEDMAPFDIALEGSKVTVTGIGRVMKVDAAYLDNWEADACSAEVDAATAGDEEQHGADTKTKIDALRAQLVESGEDYIGFYHLDCVSLEELK